MISLTGDVASPGLNAAHSGHQIGGPIGSALSMGASAPVPRMDGFLQETMHEVSQAISINQSINGICSLDQEPRFNRYIEENGREERFYKLLPANKADHLGCSWQQCVIPHDGCSNTAFSIDYQSDALS